MPAPSAATSARTHQLFEQEVLDSIPPGRMALIALHNRGHSGEYWIDSHGQVLATGAGHHLMRCHEGQAVGSPEEPAVLTSLANLAVDDLAEVVDTLGEDGFGGIVSLKEFDAHSALPVYFHDLVQSEPQVVPMVRLYLHP